MIIQQRISGHSVRAKPPEKAAGVGLTPAGAD
jgi:hypothetical protein